MDKSKPAITSGIAVASSGADAQTKSAEAAHAVSRLCLSPADRPLLLAAGAVAPLLRLVPRGFCVPGK